MKVRQVWYLNALPNHIVAETAEGRRVMFPDTPIRPVQPDDLIDYCGHDPRKCASYPMLQEILRFYGLEKV